MKPCRDSRAPHWAAPATRVGITVVQQVLITHYQRLLDYIKPDYVHVMSQGQIVRSGGPELALELEMDGYAFLDKS